MTNVDPKKIIRHGEYEKRWTFITNHAAVLSLLAKHPRITAREVSREVGITEHSVRLIVSDLDQGGYISKIREGRGLRYLVDLERPMRHKTQRDVAMSHLMSILSAKCSSIKKDHIT
jgi:predicted transcriptional regulator of viral defense system